MGKKINIAIVCDGVTSTTAGSFISTLRFSELLKKRGNKVVLISSKSSESKYVDYYHGIKVYRFRSILLPKSGKLYISFPTVPEIKKVLIEEKIDIVHIMLPTFSSLVAIKSAKSLGIPIVAHSHAQPEDIFGEKFLILKKINNLFYRYMAWIYSNADIVICPSKFSQRDLLKRTSSLKTKIISNGINLSKFKRVNPKKFVKKYNIPEDYKRLVFVGRLHPIKKVDTLIKAVPYILKEYENIHVVIVGPGYMKKSLEKMSKTLKISKNITFCGRVSEEELIMAYSTCDIFVLPSLGELEGMAVLEAMSCKNPILVANSKLSASVDFVKGNGFLFKPENPKDLAEKSLKLLKNEKLRKKMAIRSFKNSREYDINKSVKKLEEVYHSLISKR